MHIHAFLCGVAAVLIVETVALMIATAWIKHRLYRMENHENDS